MTTTQHDTEPMTPDGTMALAESEERHGDDVESLISITGLSAETVGDQLESEIWQRLRIDFPWAKTDFIDEVATRCGGLIKNALAEQQVEPIPSSTRQLLTHREHSRPVIEAKKSRISFMTLPPELRELIYDLALISEETDESCSDARNIPRTRDLVYNLYKKPVICIQRCQAHTYGRPDYYGWLSEWATQPALTQVSKQIRAESLPIYYGKNEFVVFSTLRSTEDFDVARRFLKTIGKHNASLIRRLTVLLPEYEDKYSDVFEETVPTSLTGKKSRLRRAVVQVLHGGDFGHGLPQGFHEANWEYPADSDDEMMRYLR